MQAWVAAMAYLSEGPMLTTVNTAGRGCEVLCDAAEGVGPSKAVAPAEDESNNVVGQLQQAYVNVFKVGGELLLVCWCWSVLSSMT